MSERSRGNTFDEIADLYDRVRPDPPPQGMAALLDRLPAGARVLEIGCGTGKATAALVRHGVQVTAVEPGVSLATLARRNVPAAEIITVRFEDFEPDGTFDAVVAVQSFHWVDTAAGLNGCARALRAGGTLALLWNLDVSDGTPFWRATLPLYEHFMPSQDGALAGPEERIDSIEQAFRAHATFAGVRRETWRDERVYSAQDYLDLKRTDSSVRVLPPADQERFLAGLAKVLEAFGGTVTRHYQIVLLTGTAALAAMPGRTDSCS